MTVKKIRCPVCRTWSTWNENPLPLNPPSSKLLIAGKLCYASINLKERLVDMKPFSFRIFLGVILAIPAFCIADELADDLKALKLRVDRLEGVAARNEADVYYPKCDPLHSTITNESPLPTETMYNYRENSLTLVISNSQTGVIKPLPFVLSSLFSPSALPDSLCTAQRAMLSNFRSRIKGNTKIAICRYQSDISFFNETKEKLENAFASAKKSLQLRIFLISPAGSMVHLNDERTYKESEFEKCLVDATEVNKK